MLTPVFTLATDFNFLLTRVRESPLGKLAALVFASKPIYSA